MNRRQFLVSIAAVVERIGDGFHGLARRIRPRPIGPQPWTREVMASMSISEFESRVDAMVRHEIKNERDRVIQTLWANARDHRTGPVA